MTVAKFTGWVHGRAHSNPPIEITGIPLPHAVLTDVRVTGYFPQLTPHEVAFHFDSLPVGDFVIGSLIVLTIEPAPTPATVEAPVPVEQLVPVVTAAHMPAATMDDGPVDIGDIAASVVDGLTELPI